MMYNMIYYITYDRIYVFKSDTLYNLLCDMIYDTIYDMKFDTLYGMILPHSAPSLILSLADENLASSILQDGATEWHYS